MKKNLTALILSVAATLVLVAGCESPSKVTAGSSLAPVETRTPGAAGGSSNAAGATANTATTTTATATATASGTPQSGVSTVDLIARPVAGGAAAGTALMAAPTQRVVYFDYDSFVIKDEFTGLLDGHAKVLARQTSKRMVIEGHTDERGGREYNLALGQKRAEAVAKSLSLLGVSQTQIEAVSFGEERPAAPGADETAWSRNRRAELKDR